MLSKERQDGTDAANSTNAAELPSALLLPNPMLAAVFRPTQKKNYGKFKQGLRNNFRKRKKHYL